MAYTLSPSSLSLFSECPRCFWLTQHNAWKRPKSIFPSLPSGMDSILKKHFDRFMEKSQLPPELLENSECKSLKLFCDKKLLDVWRNARQGLRYSDSEGNILMGAVDNLMVNNQNGKVIVLDYKTKGFALKPNSHYYYAMQMNIYSYLLRKNGHPTEDFAFLLFYVPDSVTETGEVIFDTTLRKIRVDLWRAERIWKDALQMLNGPCPIRSCEWCENISGKDL